MTEPHGNPYLYAVGGAVQASGGLYIERAADDEMLSACRRRAYAYLLSSRQIGKSSLIVRAAEQLNAEGVRTAIVDLSRFGEQVTAEQWYLGLLTTVADELELETDLMAWWRGQTHHGFTYRLTRFFEEVLLAEVTQPVVIFVDEIDLTLRLPFASDFFAAVRGFFQARSTSGRRRAAAYARLSFVLVGAATPDNLISNPLATPFNIATRVELSDFTYREALPLAAGLGPPPADARQVLRWILKWTGGHPYLTLLLCRLVATTRRRAQWTEARVDRLVVKEFTAGRWKQFPHFMTIKEMLADRDLERLYGITPFDALRAYGEILAGDSLVRDDERSPVKSHLKLSGLVRRKGNALVVRNMTYCRVFSRKWVQSALAEARPPAPGPQAAPAAPRPAARRQTPPPAESAAAPRARIFISYKRDARPDKPVVERVTRALKRSHDVFIDQMMPVGTKWGERIETELGEADFLIPFLSARSVDSEMVQGEIATAHRLAKRRAGRPVILPVRLNYRQPFHYPLSAYLDPVSWAFWKSHDDTPRLIKEIKRALSDGELTIKGVNSKAELIKNGRQPPLPPPLPSAQPARLELPGGTVAADSAFYVERPSDGVALGEIARQGVTVTIKGPRQMGKSSLLMRVIAEAERAGKRAIFLDFQLIDRAVLSTPGLFFRHFCRWLTAELGLKDVTGEYWRGGRGGGNALPCTRYVSRYLLGKVDRPLVLAMDEVDAVLDTSYRSDFFGMLRNWHDSRRASGSAWRKLDIVLVTSTDPHMLIDNPRQSPFNVGKVVELGDFTPAQVEDLNRRHRLRQNLPFRPDEVRRLYELLHGHPYLVRRALYLVASRALTPRRLFETAAAEDGPFADHLRYYLFRLRGKQGLIAALRQVIFESRCRDAEAFLRLKGAGLVRAEGRRVEPRCKLYADYFREHLNE